MKMRSVVPMRIAKYGYIVICAVYCLAGLLMMLLPAPTVHVIAIFFGIAMLVFGIVKLVGYFSKDLFRLAFQFDLEFGILLIALGVITLIKPGNVMSFICTALGVCTIADSLFKTKIAFDAKRFGIRQWFLTLGLAVLTGAVGLVLTLHPSEALQAMCVLLGVSLFAEGLLNLSVAITFVKIIRHQKPDVLDAEDCE